MLEKLKWIILLGSKRLGAVPKLGTPRFALPLPHRLSQDSSSVLGSQDVLDQTRRLLHSTRSSHSGTLRGQRDEPSLLQVPTQHTSGLGQQPAVPPPWLPQLRQKLGISLVG